MSEEEETKQPAKRSYRVVDEQQLYRDREHKKIQQRYEAMSPAEKEAEQKRLDQVMKTKMLSYVSLYETYGERCPGCGAMMMRPHQLNSKGFKRAGACFNCGYSERTLHHKDLTKEVAKNNALGYLRKYSVGLQGSITDKQFSNYNSQTSETIEAKNKAVLIAKKLATGNNVHAAIMGPTGVGKTHLAESIINYVQYLAKYHLKIMFLSIPLLNEIRYNSMQQNDDSERLFARIKYQIPKADIVVLDDLGAERDTEYSKQLIDLIAIEREDKALLFTSNLKSDNGTGVLDRYTSRTRSRLKAHMGHNFIVFDQTKDYRVHGIG